jgi:hypothetical protein
MLTSFMERRKTFDSPLVNPFSPVMQSSLLTGNGGMFYNVFSLLEAKRAVH